MATSATLTPSVAPDTHEEVSRALKDRVLGAVWALASRATAETTLEALRERVAEVSERVLDSTLIALDHDDEVVFDRAAGAPRISLVPKLTSDDMVGDVPGSLRDRLVGAIWILARTTTRTVSLTDIRARLVDVNRYDVDRALVALSLDGEIHLGRSGEGTWCVSRRVVRCA